MKAKVTLSMREYRHLQMRSKALDELRAEGSPSTEDFEELSRKYALAQDLVNQRNELWIEAKEKIAELHDNIKTLRIDKEKVTQKLSQFQCCEYLVYLVWIERGGISTIDAAFKSLEDAKSYELRTSNGGRVTNWKGVEV